MRFLVFLLILISAPVVYADCPNCRGQAAVAPSLPNVGVRGMTMRTHLERDHGINTAGMSAAQMQQAHNQAHHSSSQRIRNRSRVRLFRW